MNALEALAHKVVQAGTGLRYAHKIITQMREIIKENGGPVKLGFSIHISKKLKKFLLVQNRGIH